VPEFASLVAAAFEPPPDPEPMVVNDTALERFGAATRALALQQRRKRTNEQPEVIGFGPSELRQVA